MAFSFWEYHFFFVEIFTFLCYANNEKPFFSIKYFKITRKPAAFCGPAFAHFGEDEKKSFGVIYDLYKMKQFHWSLCVAKNCDWSKENYATSKPDSSVASREMKTYSKSRIKLRNPQILKKMLEFIIGTAL